MTPTSTSTPQLILASASPRRSRLLGDAGIAFEVVPADIDETPLADEGPIAMVERLAREKAAAVAARMGDGPRRPVLAADTIVVLNEQVLGKPDDAEHAVTLLTGLVGHTHQVVTGVALGWTDEEVVQVMHVASTVRMRSADEAEIREYVATGESLDKAGAYALQGEGRRFVEAVEGSETNVIGLPMDETRRLLSEAGIEAGMEARPV